MPHGPYHGHTAIVHGVRVHLRRRASADYIFHVSISYRSVKTEFRCETDDHLHTGKVVFAAETSHRLFLPFSIMKTNRHKIQARDEWDKGSTTEAYLSRICTRKFPNDN